MTVKQFCKFTLPMAAEAARRYGVNPIGVMAQAALETGWGQSTPGNMFFGIKANNNWYGKKQLLWTTEYRGGVRERVQAWFRAYDSPVDSFCDYAALISSLNRYSEAMNYPGYNQTTQYLNAIAAGGYATSPNYAQQINSVADMIKREITAEDVENALKKKS